MAGRGGGRGDQQPYGGRGAGGWGGGRGAPALRGFVWLPPGPSSPRPASAPAAPVQYRPGPATVVYHNLTATGPHVGAYQQGVFIQGPAPVPAPPAYPYAPAPVIIRAPSPSTSPSATPFQPAHVSSGSKAPAPTPATPSPAPSTTDHALFVSETALAPPAAAALVAASQDGSAASEASNVDLAPVSKKGLAHPACPGARKKVMIRADHFPVNVADNNLLHYDVSSNTELKSRATNREVLSELIKLRGKTSLGGKLPAYDGRKSLYTAGALPFESEEFVITLVDPEKKDKERAEREYKITIRIARKTHLHHLQQFLSGRQRDMPQETIQVLDVVLRESPSWNYVTVSGSFVSTTFGHSGVIGEGLESWRGYYQSLRPIRMRLSLKIDISATSFFKPVTVIQFVQEFLNLRDASQPLSDRDRVKIEKALQGVRVETNHQQDHVRRYKITGITPIPLSQLIFPVDERGTRMTVVQYFMDRYNYRLQYTSWSCLQSGSDSRPVYLPMEACKIVEGQRYSKKLNDKQVTNILRATCQRPQQREQSIHEMVPHNKYADDKFAQEFGIKVCNELVSVPACVLPPPMLRYHDSGRKKISAPSVGQWNMINKKMINGGTLDNWTCLSFSRMRPEEVQRFCGELIQMCNATGMAFYPRSLVEIQSATPNNIENALKNVHRRSREMLANEGKGNVLQLFIVILPEVSGSYGRIKKVCETDLGIVSQCCLPRHASRPNKQYLENVALEINVKVGGRNTVLERAFVRNGTPFVSEVPKTIFGADVTPPPPGEDSASSIAVLRYDDSGREKTCAPSVGQWNMTNGGTVDNSYQVRRCTPRKTNDVAFWLEFLGFKKLVFIDTESNVYETVFNEMKKNGVNTTDYYLSSEKYRTIKYEKTFQSAGITSQSKICVNFRLRGGIRDPTFHVYLQGLVVVETVYLPLALTVPTQNNIYYQLTGRALFSANLLFELLERHHCSGLCFRGRFNVRSIKYSYQFKRLYFDASVRPENLSPEGYRLDMRIAAAILVQYFKHVVGNQRTVYTPEVIHLINSIRGIAVGVPSVRTKKERSEFFNHSALMSVSRKADLVVSIHSYWKYLSGPANLAFKNAFLQVCYWNSEIVAYALLNVYKYQIPVVNGNPRLKIYDTTCQVSQLDYIRCSITHATRSGQINREQVLAFIFIVFPVFFEDFLKELLNVYIPPTPEHEALLAEALGFENKYLHGG